MSDFTRPQIGKVYANYERLFEPFEVTVQFWRRYGVTPEEVIFAKPGMWLAGPVPVEPPPTLEALPAPEEKTEAAPVLEGQARLL
jgi:hypothetical protein